MKKKPQNKEARRRPLTARNAASGRFVAIQRDVRSSDTAEHQIERRWRRSFAASQDFLAALAEEAKADLLAGRTEPLDPDAL